jgi:probable rRNA maturation factor
MDRETDVLSFPSGEQKPGKFDPGRSEINQQNGTAILGDIALSIEQAERQAEDYGHAFEREISYLTVHSVLHLLGYDHRTVRAEKPYAQTGKSHNG